MYPIKITLGYLRSMVVHINTLVFDSFSKTLYLWDNVVR
jgi:hypothetical protein